MADVKISGLASDTALDDSHYIPINDPTGPTTKRTLLSTLKSYILTRGSAKIDVSAPQGFLVNGKISRTVSSNNLTVAIKTLAGNDPSTTDPVYVRIGDTVREITAALSVTKNAGTNWMDLGSAQHATKDVDVFVYLGYNATDGVTIGFSRIPYAITYADFSTTSTNEKYCAISTITNAASTDQYEVVGRINVTLSATASFNWSVPATSIIVNRPIFETRWLNYAPIFTNFTGTITQARYKIENKETDLYLQVTQGASVTGRHTFTVPISIAASNLSAIGWGLPILRGMILDLAAQAYEAFGGTLNATSIGLGYMPIVASIVTEAPTSASVPMTWANGNDQFWLAGKYEMA